MRDDELPYSPGTLPRKDDIGAQAFFEVDMRVGRVIEALPFPEARDPALKLKVDFGPVVGVLATSAQVTNYDPSELEGRLIVGALNLGRKKIAGFTSEFLILGAYDPDGTVRLLKVEPDVEPGAPIG